MEIQFQPLFHAAASKEPLFVSRSGYVVTDESWHQKPLIPSFSRLYYVVSGSGMLISDTEEMPLEPGHVYLAPCGYKCGFYGTDSVTKLFFHVCIPYSEGGDLMDGFSHFASLPCPLEVIEKLTDYYFSTDFSKHFLLKGEIYRTIGRFLTENDYSSPASNVRYSHTVTKAISYIRDNLRANLTVAEIAASVFASPSHLNSLFRLEAETTVSGYLEELLMSEAQSLLCYTDLSVGSISERLGFCDQFYFSKRFTKYFHTSPRSYRGNRKKE